MGCNRCNQSPCNCGGPQPFYNQVPFCPENNKEVEVKIFNRVGVRIESSWNVPLPGAAVDVKVPGLLDIPVGEYLHNQTFGYFQITSFNPASGDLSLTNTAIQGNIEVGSQVPACTAFSVCPVPCCASIGQTGVFVAIDFTAPANGNCLDITVTSEQGLIAGNQVQIGSGIYTLSAVNPNDVITICNDDNLGITPGTPVIAKNLAGQYQYPVTLLTKNPCQETTVTEALVVGCNNGNLRILTGTSNGQVLQLYDHTIGGAHYVDLPAPVTLYKTAQNVEAAPIAVPFALTNTQSTASNVITLTVTNPSSVNSMDVIFNVTGQFEGTETIDGNAEILANLETDQNGAGYTTVATTADQFYGTGDTYDLARSLAWNIAVTIAPLGSYVMGAQLGLAQTKNSGAAATFDITSPTNNLICRISALGIAV